MPELVAIHTVLREGKEQAYEEVHARIPDELMDAHRRAGIHDWRIWRSGRNLFHLVECDDFAAAMRKIEQEPANQHWQLFIGDYVDHVELTATGEAALPLVWRMQEQAAQRPSQPPSTGSPTL